MSTSVFDKPGVASGLFAFGGTVSTGNGNGSKKHRKRQLVNRLKAAFEEQTGGEKTPVTQLRFMQRIAELYPSEVKLVEVPGVGFEYAATYIGLQLIELGSVFEQELKGACQANAKGLDMLIEEAVKAVTSAHAQA